MAMTAAYGGQPVAIHAQAPAGYPAYPQYSAPIVQTSAQSGPWMVPEPQQPHPGMMLPASGLELPPEASATTLVQATTLQAQPARNSADSARALHRLIESMPDEQEDFEIIERRSQLMYTKANVTRIHIADPSIIDVIQYSPRELSFIGMARGTTTMTMWFEGQDEPIVYLVKTIRDPNLDNQRRVDYGKLEKKINTLFPNSKVYLIPMSYKIIVRGQARDQMEAAHILAIIRGEVIAQDGSLFGGLGNAGGYVGGAGAGVDLGGYGSGLNGLYGGFNGLLSSFIINELQVPGEFQISLRVRIAELNRSQARNLGVDINALINQGSQQIFTNLGAAGAATIGGIFDDGNVSVLISALAANGTAKILTEPNVVVLSGRQARFLAGGEFAVPTVVGIGGAQGQTTSFRGFGTSLLVTPEVIDRDLIRISAIAEYSDLNQGNAVGGVPGTDSRRVQTTVEMREGQTLALAGLLSHRTVTQVTRIPLLGDIPKVGTLLFSNKTSTQEENELLILITPEIVRPMDAHEVPPVPGFEVTHPTDFEFYKYNMVEGAPDTGYYQLPPYGSGAVGTNVGYQHFNPGPAGSMYSPVPTNPNGTGFSSPTPHPNGMPSGPASAVPPYSVPVVPPAPTNGNGPNLQQVPGSSAQRMNGGWSTPTMPSQTIQPTAYSGNGTIPSGMQNRVQRDASKGVRY
ncbi:type II and III secretion system protein [bacterium]|nr:type II and III secretion system protein [bacterium]